MKKLSLLLAITILVLLQCHGQLSHWATPPHSWNMTGTTPLASALPGQGSVTNYSVSNGAYDVAGNLLFFVRDRAIFNASGNQVGNLPIKLTASCVIDNETYVDLNTEISIVPIPGQCKKFYVFYGMSSTFGGPLVYIIVDCSSGNPILETNMACGIPVGALQDAFMVGNHFGAPQVSFAVSKIFSGTGVTAKRFIYSVSNAGIVRSEITSSNVSSGILIASAAQLGLNQDDFQGYEAELSHNGNYFAWTSANFNSPNGDVHVIKINPTTGSYISGSLRNYEVGNAVGLEFTAGANPDLYVTSTTGLRIIKTSTNSLNLFNQLNYHDISKSYIEMGYDGKLYALGFHTIGPETNILKFVQITIGSAYPNSVSAGFSSNFQFLNGSPLGNDFYTLPDQIDGEKTFGISAGVSNILIQSQGLSTTCNGFRYKYCQGIISMLPLFVGQPNEYRISIEGINPTTCQILPVSAGKVSYVGPWISNIPTTYTDISGLTDSNNRNLNNVGGSYRIRIESKDACGVINSRIGFFDVLEPIPPTLVLEIYDTTNPNVWLSPSLNVQNPISVGTASLAYRVNNSSGSIQSYNVKIEEVNPINGQVLQIIYNKTQSISNVSTLDGENFNSYCVNQTVWPSNPPFGACTNPYAGYTGYFSYMDGINVANKTYKLTLTLSNQCSSTSGFSYIKVDLIGQRPAGIAEIIGNLDAASSSFSDVVIYPNPANDYFNVNFADGNMEGVTLTIYDLTGRAVLRNNATSSNTRVNTSALAAGHYVLRIDTPIGAFNQKVQVTK